MEEWVNKKGETKERKRVTVGNCLPQIDKHGEKQAKMKESFIVERGFLTLHHFTHILRMFCMLHIRQHPCGNIYLAVREWFHKNHQCRNKIRSTTAALTSMESIIGHKEQENVSGPSWSKISLVLIRVLVWKWKKDQMRRSVRQTESGSHVLWNVCALCICQHKVNIQRTIILKFQTSVHEGRRSLNGLLGHRDKHNNRYRRYKWQALMQLK